MITKHTFVSLLDAGEILPFAPKETDSVEDKVDEQKRQSEELERFITALQRRFGEKIYHLGSEIIEGKTFQEFMFHGSGFLEISQLAPVAINAHFHDKLRARKFGTALKGALRHIVRPSKELELLLQSVDIKDEHDTSIQFQKWAALSSVRGIIRRSVSLVFLSSFLFVSLEFGKAMFSDIFSNFLGIHKVFAAMTIAVTVAFFVRPFERILDHTLSKFVR